jgi:hypothetical protein
MDPVNLTEKFARIGDYWHPRVVGDVNAPPGRPDRRGARVLLEPKGTLNTGNVVDERTIPAPGRL